MLFKTHVNVIQISSSACEHTPGILRRDHLPQSTKPYCNFHDRPQGVGLRLTKGDEQPWQTLGKRMGELGRAGVYKQRRGSDGMGFYTLPHRAGSLATRCQI